MLNNCAHMIGRLGHLGFLVYSDVQRTRLRRAQWRGSADGQGLSEQLVVRGHAQPAGNKGAQLARKARRVLKHERRRSSLHRRAPLQAGAYLIGRCLPALTSMQQTLS